MLSAYENKLMCLPFSDSKNKDLETRPLLLSKMQLIRIPQWPVFFYWINLSIVTGLSQKSVEHILTFFPF